MISILIPCYNYNAFKLICILEKEALTLGLIFEIICIDDASFSNLNETNQKINTLTNCKFFESKKNFFIQKQNDKSKKKEKKKNL